MFTVTNTLSTTLILGATSDDDDVVALVPGEVVEVSEGQALACHARLDLDVVFPAGYTPPVVVEAVDAVPSEEWTHERLDDAGAGDEDYRKSWDKPRKVAHLTS